MRRLWERFGHLPIVARLLIANGLVIMLGAGAGTTLTKILVDLSAFELAAMFTVAGVTLSLVINYIVLRIALRPLSSLTETVNHIQDGQMTVRAPSFANQDPDIARLTLALNTMLDRVAAHTATIETNRKQLRALSAQVITAQEEERKRIARELHDETSQSLASLLIALERMDSTIPGDLADLKMRLASAHQLTAETLDGLRTLVADLRPVMLDDLGLVPAIRWFARQRLEAEGIDVEFEVPDPMPRLPPMVEIALFRISQEAINNIVKHADASQTRFSLTCDEHLILTIEDDGVGFDTNGLTMALALEHLGLFGIRERAAAIGGEAEITSTPGKGTCLRVSVPMEMDIEAP